MHTVGRIWRFKSVEKSNSANWFQYSVVTDRRTLRPRNNEWNFRREREREREGGREKEMGRKYRDGRLK